MTLGYWVMIVFVLAWPVWGALVLARITFNSNGKPRAEKATLETAYHYTNFASARLPLPGKEEEPEEVSAELPLPYDGEVRKVPHHVLDGFVMFTKGKVNCALSELFLRSEETVTVAGLVCQVNIFHTRKGELMASGVIEDPSGKAEITMYPQTWLANPINQNDVVLLQGKVRTGKILVNSLEKIGEVPFVEI